MDSNIPLLVNLLNSVSPSGSAPSLTLPSDAISQVRERAPNAEAPRQKRQKISQACDSCRNRKVKCDGVQPICGGCAKKKRKNKHVDCVYSKKTAAEGHRSPKIAAGSHHGESDIHGRKTFGNTSGPDKPCAIIRGSHVVDNGQAASSPQYADPGGDNFFLDASQRLNILPGADSMTGAIGFGGPAFFGSSSAGSFMKQIKAVVDRKVGQPSRSRTPLSRTSTLSVPTRHLPASDMVKAPKIASASTPRPLEYTLPSRRTADELVAIYWELVHPLYPFLDKQRVEAAYNSIWTGHDPGVSGFYDERRLISTVNIMMALGCQFASSIPPGDRRRPSDEYFARARELLQINLWEEGSAELVQCLLLMGQYLQSSSAHHQCWMVIGHAVRVAQSLGFHLPEFSANMQSSMERELARRIWHSCVLMDRVLSMTMGRLTIISKSVAELVPLPEDIDDIRLSRHTNEIKPELPGEMSAMTFYVRSLRLYSIVNDTLLQFYSGGEDQDQDNDPLRLYSSATDATQIAMLFKLDHDLMTWGRELPCQLRISSDKSNVKPLFRRQAIICRCRFLHARILILRPVLSRLCQPEAVVPVDGLIDESLIRQTIFQCSTLCLQAAYNLIQIIYLNLPTDGSLGLLPAWWYCVYYIYTAATVLLAARLRPMIQENVAEHTIRDFWDHAITVLKSLECFGDSSRRCVAALEIMLVNVMTAAAEPAAADVGSFDPHGLAYITTGDNAFEQPESNLDQGNNINFNDIIFNMSDLSWLNSMPGSIV